MSNFLSLFNVSGYGSGFKNLLFDISSFLNFLGYMFLNLRAVNKFEYKLKKGITVNEEKLNLNFPLCKVPD